MDFGTRLRDWRLEAGLSQRELARRAALNFSYLSKIEAGLVAPPVEDKVRALAASLGRGEDDAEHLLGLARQSRVPSDVVKAALIRNPGVGALLRRIQDRRLTEQELAALLEVVDEGPAPDEGSSS